MTTEEKAKAYDEALDRARNLMEQVQNNELIGFPDQFTEIFPELLESEDERIRKEIVEYFKHYSGGDNVSIKFPKWIAYLEKQKEQKEKATSTLAKVLEDCAEKFRRLLKAKGINYVPTNNFWNNIAIAYSKQEKLDFDKWYDDLMIPEEKQKEQKPENINPRMECDKETDVQKAHREGRNEGIKMVCEHPEEYGLQKPAEWSEDDKKWLSEVYFAIDHSMYSDDEKLAMKKYIDYLRSKSN